LCVYKVMSPLLIATIIIVGCLIIGAVGVGIYIAVFRSKPENTGRNYDGSTVALIMVTSLLVGLLIAGSYILWTGKECPECEWGANDVEALKNAQVSLDALRAKANKVPRGINYTTECEAGGGACGVSTRK